MKKPIVFITVLLASLFFAKASFAQAATTDKIVSYHPRLALRGDWDWNKDNVGSFAWRITHNPSIYNLPPTNPNTDSLIGEFIISATGCDMGECYWYGLNKDFALVTGLSPIINGKAKEFGWDTAFPPRLDWTSTPITLQHTRDEYYADARNKLMAIMTTFNPYSAAANYVIGEEYNFIMYYDWAYNLTYSNGTPVLSEADKKLAQTYIIDLAEKAKQYVTGSEHLFDATELSHYIYFKAGLALYEPSRVNDSTYVDNNGRNINQYAKNYLDDFDRIFIGKVIPALQAQGGDGGWHGGIGKLDIHWNYAEGKDNVLPLLLGRYMYIYNTAIGQGVEQSPYGEGVFLYGPEFQLHMYRPGVLNLSESATSDFLLVGGSSGYAGRYTNVGNIHDNTRRRFSQDISNQNQAELADWLRRNRWSSHKNGGSWDNINHLIYKDEWVNPRTPEQIGFSKTRRFENLGWVSMRAGFTSPDDLAALFIGQKYHWSTLDPYAQNTLYLERKGELIQKFSSPIFIDGQGQRTISSFPTISQGVSAYAPGSTYDVGPGITDFQSNSTYDYIFSDATNAYDKTKLEKFTRQLVYLKPDLFVVFDKVSTVNPATKKSWVIDPGAAPVTKTSNLFTITNGSGALWLKNLSPQETTITSQTADKFEFTPSQDAKEVYFITVLQATDAGLTEAQIKVDDALLTEDASWYTVSVAGHTLSFGKAATPSFSFDGVIPQPDTEAPTVPTGLTAQEVSSSQINLSWTASTDNVGVTNYRIYQGEAQIATSNTTSYQDKGLTVDTSYTYTVSSADAAGNESAKSSQVSATTQPTPPVDTLAPTVPAGLTAQAISSSQINLTWSASTDNIGVTGYKIYRNGVLLTTYNLQLTTYSDTGLIPNTTYTYTISSFDAANNESAKSSQAQATTLNSPPPAQELIIDNTDAAFTNTGTWWSSGYPNFYGTNALAVDINRTQSTAQATWTPNLTRAGDYQVYAWWTAGAGRINDAKYTITHANGQDTVTANQKLNGGSWNLLGTYTFNIGTSGNISLSNLSSDSNYVAGKVSDSVCADAIKLAYAGILPPDTQAPTTPANLQAQTISSTQINLSWNASTDDTGVAGYKIYRDTTQVGTSTTASYQDTGLTPNTTYTYTVSSYDTAGNASAQSTLVSATTKTTSPPLPTSGAPVLLFQDLESGPKTGWEDSTTKGAAVTIWGKNFGASRGSSYVTVNGANLTQDSDYAEWGTTGRQNGVVRDLQRTTFWLNNNAQDGVGTITITVNGITSNPLPFTVRTGNIYFISASDGNDSYNGRYSARTGHTGSDGPWRNQYLANPTTYPGYVSDGDTIYAREGIYTNYDKATDSLITYYGNNLQNPAGRPIVIAGYPGEWPQFGTAAQTGHGAMWTDYTRVYLSYLGFYKILWKHGTGAISTANADHIRIIGNRFEQSQAPGFGVIYADAAQYHQIYGNYFYQNGYGRFKHDFYYKVWDSSGYRWKENTQIDVGWNEFRENYTAFAYSDSDWGGPMLSFSSDGAASTFNNSKIHDNLFRDCIDMAFETDLNGTGINIYNNVVYNCGQTLNKRPTFYVANGEHTTSNPPGADNITNFYNNTFYAAGKNAGMIAIIANTACTFTLNMKNNIFYSVGDQFVVYLNNSSILSDHDIWHGNGGLPSRSGLTVTNGINLNPLFINPSNGDFRLQASSPAIDAGTSAVAAVVTKDYDFNLRPQGSGYDIGAYEYVSGTTPALKGDVNGDKGVDVLDIQALVNHILGIQSYGASADVNNDGSVDVLDVQLVVNIILGV
jgi:chitodextrinase